MDYSTTVNLPKTDFPMKADLPKREPAFLEQWAKERAYEKGVEKRKAQKGKKQFILHDGPPYANGHLHLGHALNKILKDIIVRYKTMAGFYSPYVPGWDCHGLPIELQLMKELGVDKHKVERAKFREQAAAFAQKFVDIQRAEFMRMGVLGDWENPYLTMAPAYKQEIVGAFLDLQKKGYVFRGLKPVYWCFVDETALAEAEVEYENDVGPSIYVAFPLHAPPDFNEEVGGHGDEKKAELWTSGSVSYVIWTTTPWTLPANLAIAINPNETYVLFEDAATKKKYILAEKRLASFQETCKLEGRVLDSSPARTFREAFARHPWIEDRIVPVLEAGFVAMDTGTGIVHIAPGHGREDYQLGSQHDLEVYSPVNDRGLFTEDVPTWKGEHVFKANPKIIEYLKSIGALLHAEEITHSYPHCWRCHKPVIFRATEQWFLNIDHDKLRSRLLQAMNTVEWIPQYGKNRMSGMVENRPDWCLSRQRLWGTEIPGGGAKDPDIFDVWFESGVSWRAVLKQRPELGYPADLYLEGSDQHRGWFQVSLIPSVALESKAPFKAVLTHGFVMDGSGRPMSKSLGNVISPEEIIKQYGADVLRLWVGSSDYGGDVRLSSEILKGLADTYRKIRNSFRYLLGNIADFNPKTDALPVDQLLEIDRWALSKLQDEIVQVRQAYDRYEFHRVASRLVSFCTTTLSGFYLDILKDRLYCDGSHSKSRRSAQTVLWLLADRLCRLWGPILSFTADEAWRFLGHEEALHLADQPESEPSWVLPQGVSRLDEVLTLREPILQALEKARQAGRIKGNLEAHLTLYSANANMASLLRHYEIQWAPICIVSQATVAAAPLANPDVEFNGLQIGVERVSGQKCGRCWIYKTDVGADVRYPEVCGRCAAAVGELVKS